MENRVKYIIDTYYIAQKGNYKLISVLGNWSYEVYDAITYDRIESFCRVGMNVNDSRKQAIEYFNNKY